MKMHGILLGGATLLLGATPALADDAAILRRLDTMQQMMELQQKQIAAQRGEIAALGTALKRRGMKIPLAEITNFYAAGSASPVKRPTCRACPPPWRES